MCDLILPAKYFNYQLIKILTLVFELSLLLVFPLQDLTIKPRYLVTFTVGFEQKRNIDAAVKKVSWKGVHTACYCISLSLSDVFWQFSENFTIVLFHYDGRASEWENFEWSKRAIHVSVYKQTKWSVTSSLQYNNNLP